MILRPYQQQAVEAVYTHLRNRQDNPVVVLPTGCHAYGHPILMFDGTLKKVQDIRVGDRIMGDDSTARTVQALCRGRETMYRIIPRRGKPFIVNENHILSLVSTCEGKHYPSCQKGGEITHIPVKDYLQKSKSWRHLRKLYHVPVEFPSCPDLPIPPYLLGLLLGDGSFCEGIEFTSADEELGDEVIDYAHSIGAEVRVESIPENKASTYCIIQPRGKGNILINALKEYGLDGCRSEHKFIPQEYMTAGRDHRLQLLAGLLDSDGYLGNHHFDYITKSKELADDIDFMACSLGLSVKQVEKYCRCQTGYGGWYYRVHISGDLNRIPCRRNRHKNIPGRKQKKDVLRTGFRIEKLPEDDFYGFTIDGNHLYVDGHFVVHHNSGKTPVMATLCSDAVLLWRGRVLILAHVKELLEQMYDTLQAIAPELDVGVYSAGLGRKDTDHPVIIAGIQSVYQKAAQLPPFDLVIVDEAHCIPPEGEGRYQRLLSELNVINPQLRVVGLTATPYRMTSGMICQPDHFLNHICCEVGIKELIRDGFLCPLRSKASKEKIDTENLHLRAGEFISSEVEELMDTDYRVRSACQEIVEYTRDRHSVLIFASGIEHGKHIQKVIEELSNMECGFVSSKSPTGWRQKILKEFKSGDIKYLCNVNVLTTGFDARNIDCVAMLRPTMSPGLYYQMVGRGCRIHESKQDCLILDFSGNVLRHGPVDAIRVTESGKNKGQSPAKECPDCQELIHAAYMICPACGYEFPPPNRGQHEANASDADVLSEIHMDEYDVQEILYSVHTKKGSKPDDPKTMRVQYKVGYGFYISEWVCFEHTGYAHHKAVQWWTLRSDEPIPQTAQEAVDLAWQGRIAEPTKIITQRLEGERFERIVHYELGPKPEYYDESMERDDGDLPEYIHDDWEIPF